jgi:uncharacterized protein YcgI (DUF1989 family)
MHRENLFDNLPARANSSYCTVQDGQVVMPDGMGGERARVSREAFEQLQEFIVRRTHPCVGAQGAFNRETYRFGTYRALSKPEVTPGLARDLTTFVSELAKSERTYMSFLAIFDGPLDLTERTFEDLLWRQLAQLHVLDRRHHTWDASVSSDPEAPTFAFSFAGRAFYVVGMHPRSSRLARRFARPMLVFNARSQFDRLRERGTYAKMQHVIRERDRALQGSINPMLHDLGEVSDARQYSGRAVPDDWTCPFHDAVTTSLLPTEPDFQSPMAATATIRRTRIEPSTGTAFQLRKGQRLKVIDPEGEQVADLMCYADEDRREWLSSGRTFDYESTLLLTSGNDLWSNRSRRMLRVVDDTCGRHDFLLTPCSPEMYRILYGINEHPSCLANLQGELAPYGIEPDAIPTTFNIFMNVQFQPDGRISVEPPQSQPGDYIVFEALMDLVVGLTACAAEKTNNDRLTPIDFEIIESDVFQKAVETP